MKKTFTLLVLAISVEAFGQFTVAPFGSGNSTPTPIGDDRKNQCSNKRCGFELIIKPFCFGTNLRAYPLNIQMDPSKTVKSRFTFEGDGKKDQIEVTFPANMTYASGGSRVNCTFKDGEDTNKAGSHSMSCFLPWMNKSYTYTLREWLMRRNPGISSTFNNYAGIGLPARLDSKQGDDVDKEITCLYRFTKHRGDLIKDSVACYFPSRLPDLSSQIRLVKDGSEISDAEVTAYTNMIKIKFRSPMNSMSAILPVKHGKIKVDKPPKHHVSFFQSGGARNKAFFNPWATPDVEESTVLRQIAAVKEKESFDESNAYQSFTTQVKFAGMEGFCGGYYSPLMLFFDEKLPKFNGISAFPLYGMPEGTAVNWPERGAPGYFLVHLKKGETKVSSYKQLFGQTDQYDNGFLALKIHDKNGDNQIDKEDPVFSELYLWNDIDGDGYSQSEEIVPVKKMNVKSIGLKYTTRDVTNFDNRARVREKGSFTFEKDGQDVKAQVYDVWFAPLEQ